VFLLVFGLVLVAVGALIALTSPDDRGFALLGLLPWGVGSVAVASTPFLTREAAAVRLEELSGRRSGPAVVFPFSRAKQRLGFIGQVSFVFLGLAVALYTDGFVIGVICMAMFGLFALITLPSAIGRRGGVALLPAGVLVRGALGDSFLPWEQIEDLQDVEIHGSRMLGIAASDPAKLEVPPGTRLLSRANRALGYRSDLSIAAASLIGDLEVVAAAIEYELIHPEHRSRLGTRESLEDLDLAAAL
jgi:hypothetical protein